MCQKGLLWWEHNAVEETAITQEKGETVMIGNKYTTKIEVQTEYVPR